MTIANPPDATASARDSAWGEELARGAQAMGLALEADQYRRLLDYLALMRRWNRFYNLTRIVAPAQMIAAHLLDSFTVLPYLKPARILDVGTGAGLPGVPLAIVRPDWELVLLDSNSKKTRFLNQVKIELQLANVSVVHERVERYRDTRGFDSVVCRALTSLQAFVDDATPLCRPGGRMVAMKGRYPGQELDVILAHGLRCSVERVAVPGINAQRHLVIIEHPGEQ